LAYKNFQEWSSKYGGRGLTVFAFPCNQFGGQEPWEEGKIKGWVSEKFGFEPNGVSSFMSSKVSVNGNATCGAYEFLKADFPGDISWNFKSTFIVGRDGKVRARIDRTDMKKYWADIEAAFLKELGG